MGQALTITRTDQCAADLRAAASKSDDAAQVRRLLAIALALDGEPRSEAAERSGMDRQTLRNWVHRYNDARVARRGARPTSGRQSARARSWCKTIVMTPPVCLAPSAPLAVSGLPSSCQRPTPRR